MLPTGGVQCQSGCLFDVMALKLVAVSAYTEHLLLSWTRCRKHDREGVSFNLKKADVPSPWSQSRDESKPAAYRVRVPAPAACSSAMVSFVRFLRTGRTRHGPSLVSASWLDLAYTHTRSSN